MKMNIFYFFAFILLSTLFSCSGGPANDPRSIYTYQTMQGEMFNTCYRMYEGLSEIKEIAEDKSEPFTQKRAKYTLEKMYKMEQNAGEIIKLIEDTKRMLFLQMNENMEIDVPNCIRSSKYDVNYPISPIVYQLSKVKNNETTNLLSPDGAFAKKIQSNIKHLRKELTELAAIRDLRDSQDKSFFFKDPDINSYSSLLNLREKIEKSGATKHTAPDDLELILRIYERLSYKQDFWDACLKENLSWIEAFGFLISLEADIINATNDAMACLRYRHGSCGCIDIANFVPLVTGEERLLQGQNPRFEVLMAGIMSHKTPIFEVNGAKIIHIRDGVATITAEMGKDQEKTITGTLTIFNKSGIPKTYPWKKTFYREPN
ncbi:MAG: hypothetical protein RLZ33_2387 [Bacteroidota bacterium]|jgi:hypothetical protein